MTTADAREYEGKKPMPTDEQVLNALMEEWQQHGDTVKNLRVRFSAALSDLTRKVARLQEANDVLAREVTSLEASARCAAEIANLLDGQEWEPVEDLGTIASLLRAAGYEVRDPNDPTVADSDDPHPIMGNGDDRPQFVVD